MQDLPPKGGFPRTIRYQRYIPSRGPSGATLFIGAFAIMGWGWYWVFEANRERMELTREKHWARIHMVPILQAETDRDLVRRFQATEAREAFMKIFDENWSPMDLKAKVPGVGKYGKFDPEQAEPVYHTKRYVQPNFVSLPESSMMKAQWWRGSKMFLKNIPFHEREDFKGENPNY
ncbi:MAG: hypothetical protein SGCHY_004022 [Lobulomycetales sp.]